MQRLRHRVQAGARDSLGREPPPRRHDQRRRARRALDLGRLHALLRCAVHGRLPGRLLLPDRGRRRAARQGPVHRLRLLLLRVPVRRAAVPAGRRVRRPRQDGQVHVLRGRTREGHVGRRVQEVRPQSPRRRQASRLRRNVLDQGAARRRRRRAGGHLSRARDDPRPRRRRLGLGDGLRTGPGRWAARRAAAGTALPRRRRRQKS